MKRIYAVPPVATLFASIMPLFAQAPAVQVTPTNDTGIARVGSMAVPMGTVNLVNGNLSLELPLITLPGRGGGSYPLALQYDSKIWSPHMYFPSPTDAIVDWRYELQAYNAGLGWHH